MANELNIQNITARVPAGQQLLLNIVGNFLRCETANFAFKVEANGSNFVLKTGRWVRLPESQNQYIIVNDTGSDLTAVLAYGFGEIQDSAVTGDVVVNSATQYSALATVGLLAGVGAPLAATNVDRAELMLCADIANPGPVFLSGTVGQGVPLYPGVMLTLTCTDAITGISAGAATVYVAEVVK